MTGRAAVTVWGLAPWREGGGEGERREGEAGRRGRRGRRGEEGRGEEGRGGRSERNDMYVKVQCISARQCIKNKHLVCIQEMITYISTCTPVHVRTVHTYLFREVQGIIQAALVCQTQNLLQPSTEKHVI